MNITAATQEGDAESSRLVDRDEEYNTRYGGYMGYVMAFDRLIPIPRATADLDLVGLVTAEDATTAEAIVDHFVRRFLRVPVDDAARAVLVERLRQDLGGDRLPPPGPRVEGALRSLLYLVLSAPEYQLA